MFEMPVRRTYELLGDQLDQLRKNKKVKPKVSHSYEQSPSQILSQLLSIC